MAPEAGIEEKLKHLPERPGVYLFYDSSSQVIYVGKAGSLRRRVRSYFTRTTAREPRVEILVQRVADLEYIVTDTEIQALILESTLIKRHKPRYNVNLKDDKQYPYLKITAEEFPRLLVTRKVRRDGGKYYGPFTDTGALRETVRLLKQVFGLRTCRDSVFRQRRRPCLNYYIGRCTGPCAGHISPSDYQDLLADVRLVLEGQGERLRERLQREMEEASASWRFETAARLRDQINALDRVLERQRLPEAGPHDQDVVAYAREQGDACFQVFFIRQGKVVGRDRRFLESVGALPDPVLVADFLKQYYSDVESLVREILLSAVPEDRRLLEDWLGQRRQGRVHLRVPQQGNALGLVTMVEENARWALGEYRQGEHRRRERALAGLRELSSVLGLEQLPGRIEGYDLSTWQGKDAVGVRVVFQEGLAYPGAYRRYRIRNASGSDDYAMLREVLERRFRQDHDAGGETGEDWPQLVLVDGGRGQVETAREALEKCGCPGLVVLGLAKQQEEVFFPGYQQPMQLEAGNPGLQLLQQVRDEAHRFAVNYHRHLRGKSSLRSLLEEIPGIGPRRRQALLQHFGDLEEISQASLEELAALPGMNRKAAGNVASFFRGSADAR